MQAVGEALLEAIGGLGTDERRVFELLEGEDPALIHRVDHTLDEISGGRYRGKAPAFTAGHTPLHGALKEELSGSGLARAEFDLELAGALARGQAWEIHSVCVNHGAAVLHKAMDRLGTDEAAIERVLGVLSPGQLAEASENFGRWYCQKDDSPWSSLRDAFESELSGTRRQRALAALDAADGQSAGRPGMGSPPGAWATPPA